MVFDFDLNILRLEHPVILYPKPGTPGGPIEISSNEYDRIWRDIGTRKYPGYEERTNISDPKNSSYRYTDATDRNYFLDALKAARKGGPLQRLAGPELQRFVEALKNPHIRVCILTSRGHSPEQFLAGLEYLRDEGVIPAVPRLEDIHTVSYQYGPTATLPNPEAKKLVLGQIADQEEAEAAKDPSGERHYLEYSDDSATYIEGAEQTFETSRSRWPHLDIGLIYSGDRNPKFPSRHLIVPDRGKTRAMSAAEVRWLSRITTETGKNCGGDFGRFVGKRS
jgi:hypothetical protein